MKEANSTKDHLAITNLQTPLRPPLLTLKGCHSSTEPPWLPRATVLQTGLAVALPEKKWDGQGAQAQTSGRSPPTTWGHLAVLHLGPPCSALRPCQPSGVELRDKALLPRILFRLQDPLRCTCQLVPTGTVLAHSLQPSFPQPPRLFCACQREDSTKAAQAGLLGGSLLSIHTHM